LLASRETITGNINRSKIVLQARKCITCLSLQAGRNGAQGNDVHEVTQHMHSRLRSQSLDSVWAFVG